jgi:hypothetical protein
MTTAVTAAASVPWKWMQQIARNLTDPEDGFLRGVRYLILDRDPLSRGWH